MIRPNTFARITGTTEPLYVLAVDEGKAWLRDDAGNHMTQATSKLEPVEYTKAKSYLLACAVVGPALAQKHGVGR